MRTCVQIHVKLGMVAYIHNVSSPSVGWEEERDEPFTSYRSSILVYIVMKKRTCLQQGDGDLHTNIMACSRPDPQTQAYTHTERGDLFFLIL